MESSWTLCNRRFLGRTAERKILTRLCLSDSFINVQEDRGLGSGPRSNNLNPNHGGSMKLHRTATSCRASCLKMPFSYCPHLQSVVGSGHTNHRRIAPVTLIGVARIILIHFKMSLSRAACNYTAARMDNCAGNSI